ncbi:MAG: 30S ribosomal protein S20 [Alphaproteobacteria bacterium]
MANIQSAKKRIRSSERSRVVNATRRARIRTFVKKVRLAIESGDQKAATEALKEAQPEMQRGVTKGILKKNTVARTVSRLAKQVNALAPSAK